MEQRDYFDTAHTTPQGSKRIADKIFPLLIKFFEENNEISIPEIADWIKDLNQSAMFGVFRRDYLSKARMLLQVYLLLENYQNFIQIKKLLLLMPN